MKNPILVPELKDLLKKKKHNILKSFLDDHHEKENAEYLGLLDPNEIWKSAYGPRISHRGSRLNRRYGTTGISVLWKGSGGIFC